MQLFADGHDEVFIVKGLATRLSDVLSSATPIGKYPHLRTVLLPWKGAITYFATIVAAAVQYSAAELDAMTARVDTAYERALKENRVHRQLTDPALGRPVDTVDPGARNQMPALSHAANRQRYNADKDGSEILIRSIYWTPTQELNQPGFREGLQAAILQQSRAPVEGFKVVAMERVTGVDDKPCLMCSSGKSFGRCCKQGFLRAKHIHAQKNDSDLFYAYNPPSHELCTGPMMVAIEQAVHNGLPFDASKWLKISLQQVCEIEVTISKSLAKVVTERLNDEDAFHNRTKSMWDLIGYVALNFPMGLLTFGSVELLPLKDGKVRTTSTSATDTTLQPEPMTITTTAITITPTVTMTTAATTAISVTTTTIAIATIAAIITVTATNHIHNNASTATTTITTTTKTTTTTTTTTTQQHSSSCCISNNNISSSKQHKTTAITTIPNKHKPA